MGNESLKPIDIFSMWGAGMIIPLLAQARSLELAKLMGSGYYAFATTVYAGLYITHLDFSPNFCAVLFGICTGASNLVSLGIPFLRSALVVDQESVPASAWIGVYNATSLPEDCIQYSHVTHATDKPVHGSEDCLYLNVYTPKLSSASSQAVPLDVLVFIHGGAFMYFTGSHYRPEYLLDKDVILVTLNYRLGALGFLSTEDSSLPGNNGMKDQSLALRWVKNNIASFGGNPNSITIAGLSAGGASVHYHILSPLSQGLFNKAISLGGSALCPWTQVENARGKTMTLAAYLGCPTHDSAVTVKCLQKRPAKTIVTATKIFMPWMYNPYSPFGIVMEPPGPTAFISERPIDIILQGKAKDLPYMTTMNADEGLYPGAEIFANPKEIEAIDTKWKEYLPFLLDYNYTAPAGQMDAISEKIWKFYLGNGHVNDAKQKFIKMLGDRLFYAGLIKSTKLHAQLYKSPVYSYLFSHKGSRRLSDIFNMPYDVYDGTGHGDDVGYVVRAAYMPLEDNSTDMALSKRMVEYWVAFIKGFPMPKGWPTVKENLPNFGFLEIQNADAKNDIVRIESDYGNEIFWDSLNLNENIPNNNKDKEEL
ncbi:venom carboxylesterase-6-like isoform X2 [Rhodnius prolixus]|uniref:venom carboxylesterase-6-like isoform X2 n=1 Tax=Rhodnius prolixus TaxID=13249 RepID=UPI003D18EF89